MKGLDYKKKKMNEIILNKIFIRCINKVRNIGGNPLKGLHLSSTFNIRLSREGSALTQL